MKVHRSYVSEIEGMKQLRALVNNGDVERKKARMLGNGAIHVTGAEKKQLTGKGHGVDKDIHRAAAAHVVITYETVGCQ